MADLPLIRSHERITYKRCVKKWYWNWRMGLVPKAKSFGALELGTWVHDAFAHWYMDKSQDLSKYFNDAYSYSVRMAEQAGAPQFMLDKADELAALGDAMMVAYQERYGTDSNVHVIGAEIPLEFEIADEAGKVIAIHKLKPDLVYRDEHDYVWLMEHKTAAQIRLEHLVIDDQARPYVTMAERALRNAGFLNKHDVFKGVMYNFARKALPDERSIDTAGRALNKNGTVSKRQPTPTFIRHPVTLTRAAKRITLQRLQGEAILLTMLTESLKAKRIDPATLPKTPHSSCPKLCQYFTMCVTEEQGGNIKDMQRDLYVRQNPYTYDEEHPTTEIPASFELS